MPKFEQPRFTSLIDAPNSFTGHANELLVVKSDESGVEFISGGSGSVTDVSVVSANGFAGSVADSTTTPSITISTTITGILSGNGTAISAASTTGTGNVVLASSPTIVTPTIASFTNATHNHTNAAGGGTLTSAAISDFDTQVRTNKLNQMSAPSAAVSMNSFNITNLANAVSAQDAVTKSDLDAVVSGLVVKLNCNYASTANIPGTYVGSPTFTLTEVGFGALSVDGATPSVGDRILLKDQTTGTQNGIYTVTVVGSGGSSYVLTRATDFDASAEILTGDYTFIISGATNASRGFYLTTPATITLDTTALTFTQFISAASYVGGAGLTLSGLTFAVGAGTGITVNADDVAVDTAVVATTSNTLSMSNKTLTSPILITPEFSGGTTGSILFVGSSSVITQDNANLFYDSTKKYLGLSIASPTANLHINQIGLSTGSPNGFNYTGGAHTTLTASTEAVDMILNLSRVVQFSTGALTTQRAIYIQAPTYAFVGASTLSTAATLAISSSPTAGTNATLTRTYSLMSENGNVCFTMSSNAALVVDFLGANSVGTTRSVTFKGALSASASGSNFVFATTGVTRTAGSLLSVVNNTTTRFSIAFNGAATITQAAGTSGSPSAFNITGGAHTTLTLSTEASDVSWNFTRTVQFATGAITTQRTFKISSPTYAFVGSSTITNCALVSFDGAPSVGTNAIITNVACINIGGDTTQASSTNFTYSGINIPGHTVTITGNTSMTTARGACGIGISQITLSAASAVTLTNASSLYIAGGPIAGGAGPLAITNSYAIFVDSGTSRFDGTVQHSQGVDVASANDLTLAFDGNTFNVTGTTQINAIMTKTVIAGTEIILIFQSSVTVKHNTAGGAGTAKIFLNGSIDLSATTNTVLKLVYDGTQFQEVSRKIA